MEAGQDGNLLEPITVICTDKELVEHGPFCLLFKSLIKQLEHTIYY